MPTCFAEGCKELVQKPLFMCNRHWKMVPFEIGSDVWKRRRARLPDRVAVLACIAAVAVREGTGPIRKELVDALDQYPAVCV